MKQSLRSAFGTLQGVPVRRKSHVVLHGSFYLTHIPMLPYCVYVLYSELDHQLYAGFTTSLERRLNQHHSGEVKSTAHRRPLRLIFCEYYVNNEDALRREKYFKTNQGKRALKLMLRHTFHDMNLF